MTSTARAKALGIAGEKAVGITGSKVGIKVPWSGRMRFPDLVQPKALLIKEVKNVAKQSYTAQLRDYVGLAKQNGYTVELWVRPSTKLSGPLERARLRGENRVKYIPGTE